MVNKQMSKSEAELLSMVQSYTQKSMGKLMQDMKNYIDKEVSEGNMTLSDGTNFYLIFLACLLGQTSHIMGLSASVINNGENDKLSSSLKVVIDMVKESYIDGYKGEGLNIIPQDRTVH